MSSQTNLLPGTAPAVPGRSTFVPSPKLLMPLWSRYLPLLGLVVTTIISTWLIVAHYTHQQLSGGFADFVQNDRATTQIIVGLLATFMSLLQIYPVTKIMDYSSKQRLIKHGYSLDELQFWTCLSAARPDFTVGKRRLLVLLLFWALNLVPPSLWTGALTPIAGSMKTIPNSGELRVPWFSKETEGIWKQGWNFVSKVTQNDLGSFSFEPVVQFQGRIINNAGGASTHNGSARLHTKQDNSGYQYRGRSFGIGSSVGLVTNDIKGVGYQYIETGYMTNVSCYIDPKTTWSLALSQNSTNKEDGSPDIWIAHGSLPNGLSRHYYLPSLSGLNLFAVSFVGCGNATYLKPTGCTSYLGVAAGRNLVAGAEKAPSYLDATCTISLKPQKFKVDVDTVEKLIVVQRLGDTPLDVEQSGFIAYAAAGALQRMAQIGGMWASIYANALISNINNLGDPVTGSVSEANRTRGISEAFESMVDDYLASFASAQLMITNDTNLQTLDAKVVTVMIGDIVYVILVVVINTLIVIVLLLSAILSKSWRGLPVFDHTDIRSMIVASSKSVPGIGATVVQNHLDNGTEWNGESGDAIAGKIELRLRMSEGIELIRKTVVEDEEVDDASSFELHQVAPIENSV